ncbi:unnamed protein product [Blepharisma stoltei]|uniref:Uncharacterized protein n=1 Tax=Blepharisma stoltei TaxID=1481888 RepID=A0AAU9JVI4_9CILI|nr:unnamed protein product [Blepharisma stoltei]
MNFPYLFKASPPQLLLCISLIVVCSSQSMDVGQRSTYFDPGRITWWKENWSINPIVLDTVTTSATATFTFNFRLSNDISNGIIEITFPSSISLSGGQTVTISSASYYGSHDSSVQVTNVKLPSTAGAYGPFAIQTRNWAGGQIIDINKVFGCVAIVSAVTASTSLTVKLDSGASSPTIESTDNLIFSFTISQDLWKHDLIVITPDSTWTPSSTVSCLSQNSTSWNSVLFGPNNDGNLPCALDSSKTITIYGLAQDVLLGSASHGVILKISKFTLPSVAYQSSDFKWKINIVRWGTNAIIAQYTASSGPTGLSPGTLKLVSWSPNSSISLTDVVQSMSLYMVLSFTTSHSITAGGSAIVTMANVDSTKNWWSETDGTNSSGQKCYVTPYVSGLSCTVTSATVLTITTSTSQISAQTFYVYMLVKFLSGTPGVSSIVTKNSAGRQIDISSAGITFTYSTSNTIFSTFEFSASPNSQLMDDPQTGYWVGGAGNGRYLFYTFSPANSWDTSTTIDIYCPLTIMGISYTQIFAAQDATVYDYSGSTQAISEDVVSQSVSQSITVYSSHIYISIVSPPSANYYSMVVSGSGQTAYPLVASNLATYYECWAKAKTTTTGSASTYIGSWQFSVTQITASSTDIYTVPMCLSNIPGIPLIAYFTALQINMDFSTTNLVYQITFSGMSDLGIGLSSGSSVPFYSSEVPNASVVLSSDSSSNVVLTITNLGSFNINDVATLYIPKGVTATTYTVTNQLSYTLSSNPTLVYYVYSNSATVTYSAGTTFTTATTLTSYTKTVNQDFSMSFQLATSLANVDKYIGIVIPQGFQVSSSTTMAVSGINPTNYIYISSTDQRFKAGVVIGTQTGSFQISNSATQLDLTNIHSALGASSASENNVAFYAFQADPTSVGSACLGVTSSSITGVSVNSATIATYSFSPDSYQLRGPGAVSVTMTINFSTVNLVPQGGKIEIVLSSNFVADSSLSSCNVQGPNAASGLSISCAISSNTLTITNFADISASTSVAVYLNGLLPPSSGTSSAYLSSIKTYDYIGKIIDLVTSFTQTCSLSTAQDVGTSSIKPYAFPNQAGLKAVDIELDFSLSVNIPAGGVIKITNGIGSWLYTSGSIANYCWSSLKYSSCQLQNSAVQLTLSSDYSSGGYISVYLDGAMDLPSINGTTTNGFSITSLWNGVTLTTDSSSTPLTINDNAPTTITPDSTPISVNFPHANEKSRYNFTFSSGSNIDSGDSFWIVFPNTYDPFIGDALNSLSSHGQTYYLSCSSSALGSSISCSASHWILVISGITSSVTAGTSLSILVWYIRNPSKGDTSNFIVYHMSSSESVKSYTSSYGKVTISDVPSVLTLKGVSVADSELLETTDYTFDFYTSGTFTSQYSFYINFPDQYSLYYSRGSQAATCSCVYYDESGTTDTDSTKAVSWNPTTSCQASYNYFEVEIPSSTSQQIKSNYRISVTLSSIPNPEYGLPRVTSSYWDMTDYTTFSDYDFWTTRFEVLVYDNTNLSIIGKSYGLLNSAYLGFTRSYYPLSINNYSPMLMTNRVVVYSGSQSSDLVISTGSWPCVSQKVVLTPTINAQTLDNGGIKLTSSIHEFTIYQMVNEINFRVSASSATAAGLYYVDWSTAEVVQDGIENSQYVAPYNLLVEVTDGISKMYMISVDTIPMLYIGYTSIPIKVSIPAAPATDISVSLAFESSTGISVYPTSLAFLPDIQTLYFEIKVDKSYDTSQKSPKLVFTLTGTDAAIFLQPESKTLKITSGSSGSSPIATLTAKVISGTEAVVTVGPSQTGLLYWYLSCAQTPIPTFDELKTITSDLIYSDNNPSLNEQLKRDYSNTEVNPMNNVDDDIVAFMRRKYADHCETPYYEAVPIYQNNPITLDFDWLFGGTSYTLTTYIDNRVINTTLLQAASKNFTTSSLPTIYKFTVYFSGNIASKYADGIRLILAQYMGINPLWLYDQIVTTSKYKPGTLFNYTVLFDRSKPQYTSAMILQMNSQSSLAKAAVQSLVGSAPTFSSFAITSDEIPQWSIAPSTLGVTDTSAFFTATTDTDGITCFMCATSKSPATLASQVLVGLTTNNTNSTIYHCIDTYENTPMNFYIGNLSPGTTYYCYFTACSSYPLWPSCIEGDDYSGVAHVYAKMKNRTTSGGWILTIGLLACLIIS